MSSASGPKQPRSARLPGWSSRSRGVSPRAALVRLNRERSAPDRGDALRYALLIYTKPDSYDGLSEEQRRAVSDEYWAIRDDPRVIGGARLQPAPFATTVRVQDQQTIVS